MNRYTAITSFLSLLLLASAISAPVFAAPPPIQRPMGFVEDAIEGGSPSTVDYSVAYDTASGELIQNMMEPLIVFDGEHTDQYLPSIGTNWTATSLGAGVDSGNPISGLQFENPSYQPGPNAFYYYRYDFKIRSGVTFQPPYNYSLTPADVAYSFQRTMVQDRTGGPQWMIQEPLLDNAAGDDATFGGIADLTNATQVAELGALIRDSVQCNSTDVWFNLMFIGEYAPFLQILAQTWSSIESKQWINNQVITGAGRPDWNGDWTNVSAWITKRNQVSSPLDTPTPMMYGSGPFQMLTLDYSNSFWEATRNVGYWRGWPADYPSLLGAQPAGYVDTVHVTWAYTWPIRYLQLTSGEADFAAVPREYLSQLYQNGDPPYAPPNYPKDGLRCIQPLPQLSVDAFFFTFNINPGTLYGPIGPPGVFDENLVPSDFFGNATWGINVRKAFAQAFDYQTFLNVAYLGEASHPATAIIPGLSYYDPTVTGWSYNLAAANASFNAVPGLSTTGFRLTLTYTFGDLARQTACNLLQSAVQSLNPRYHINVVGIAWIGYLHAAILQQLPMFSIGKSAGFPDPHDFAFAFYHTGGTFAAWQGYSNSTMSQLVEQGIAAPDGPSKALIYTRIQQGAISDVPDFTLNQPIGRHFERDWVVGSYYSQVYPGYFFYNLWKWYYVPESLDDAASQPHGFNLPADVNYDGTVNIIDVSTVAKAFGATYGPPIHPRWNFRADVNNDRKIDIRDSSYVNKQFGRSSAPWTPGP